MTKRSKNRPRITVRSAAEMLGKPPTQMAPVLRSQKFPTAGDGKQRLPYYQQPVTGIRRYYTAGARALAEARAKIQGFKQASKRSNNARVIGAFESSELASRRLSVVRNRRYAAVLNGVELSLSADLQAIENGKRRIIYLNCKKEEYKPEMARQLLEIAWWVLRQEGVDVQPDELEFDDLFAHKTHRIENVRASTIEALGIEASAVNELWDELIP